MKTKPRFYQANILIGKVPGPVAIGETGIGSVTIQNVSFIWKRLTTGMLSPNNLQAIGPGSPLLLLPDPYFLITFRSDSHVFTSEPMSISAGLGGPGLFGMPWLDLPSPVELDPKTTISFELTTQLARFNPVSLQLVLAGVEPAESGISVA